MSWLVENSKRSLGDSGPFAKLVPQFRARPQQAAMTQHVAKAIENGETLAIEAGTGVGKTFAYLVPAVLSGKKVVISTATRYLQDQIYSKDLPRVLEALGIAVDVALLKGRANYLCLERLEREFLEQSLLDRHDRDKTRRIYEWSKTDPGGDISNFPDLGEDDPLWASLTSTTENCLGSRCPKFDKCCVVAARSHAKQAEVVIINHYLLLADLALKEEGFSQLFPDIDTVIVDEAHQLRDIADRFFSIIFTESQCNQFLHDVQSACEEVKVPELVDARDRLQAAAKEWGEAFRSLPDKGLTAEALANAAVVATRDRLSGSLERLTKVLGGLKGGFDRLAGLHDCVREMQRRFAAVCTTNDGHIGWYQHTGGSLRLYASPAEVAPLLDDKTRLYKANWIYTSATLSVNADFSYFLSQAGLGDDCLCVALDSPFDYSRQAALYIPEGLPEPNDAEHTRSVVEASYPLLEMSRGGVFFLFTSYRALRIAEEKLKQETDRVLLVQGTVPKAELIRKFFRTPEALLLGTTGFWEGVDVRGAGLCCVIIDRLPFASPADPLIQGRMREAKELGRNFFRENMLPEAVISLRQGIGRLIRDETDLGAVMIGDRRLRTKSYGKVFLNSLPRMKYCKQASSLRFYLGAGGTR